MKTTIKLEVQPNEAVIILAALQQYSKQTARWLENPNLTAETRAIYETIRQRTDNLLTNICTCVQVQQVNVTKEEGNYENKV